MANHQIKAQRRKDEGKGASRRLRHAGMIPAIIYGGEQRPVSIQLNHEQIWLAQQNEWFYSSILDLNVDGAGAEKVLLRDLQRHPYRQLVMHVDFQRVSSDAKLSVAVPLHFINQATSPAGKVGGVVITHELNEVQVSCLPKDLPEFIEVDLSTLNVGHVIHLSDITFPIGVELSTRLDKEHDMAVVIAKHAVIEDDAPAEEGEGDSK
ncbi:50S ribosomal protein L25/general stress protein Ctc [Xylella fastidiosa subsp. morus]|jgi:large subunit ribosomal protein L25|uniref:Large ribosomal subunit protein bL25 n=3 Tax=Xylella fastidiosa TaxID=2371 RepID=RL25_XYLFT|nr:50S ribosomal protein L25/general stress protein Ctc [Xylella fastidiosa]B2IA79.1 RecName: Full=Large ribosomal subunit protein bL25; AltName: Full=50S ribosomal protein L25; AltName: Full=General stress protein CTC [Xylella fastidiosa M23]Q87A23.1 RecName: Full=Large ribosomal subunit protein bL25; AltName: Full=50S ribosomal protein L25; AltName: Full=General stress protein CTC [Xylella fastidiosa Temecula1]ADN62878.1 50S ribosomal protein L25/general stress protein Ctc [Xylella fastidiosa 